MNELDPIIAKCAKQSSSATPWPGEKSSNAAGVAKHTPTTAKHRSTPRLISHVSNRAHIRMHCSRAARRNRTALLALRSWRYSVSTDQTGSHAGPCMSRPAWSSAIRSDSTWLTFCSRAARRDGQSGKTVGRTIPSDPKGIGTPISTLSVGTRSIWRMYISLSMSLRSRPRDPFSAGLQN